MKTIGSQDQQLGSYGNNKISLSCCDNKRYPMDSYDTQNEDVKIWGGVSFWTSTLLP